MRSEAQVERLKSMEEEKDNEGLQLGCNLLATKILKEYVLFVQAKTSIEIEAFTDYHITKMIDSPTPQFRNQVLEQVLRLMRVRSGGHNNTG